MESRPVGSRSALCPSCSAQVEPDWLTCRSCGAILAAVRRAVTASGPAGEAVPAPGPSASPAGSLAPPPPVAAASATSAPGAGEAPHGWPDPPPPPADPPPPSTPPVHTAAIAAAPPPPANPELGPNQWYSSRFAASQSTNERASSGSAPIPKAGAFADLPLSIPQTAGGRVATIGLAAIAIAFFLPWSPLLPGLSLFDVWGFGRGSRIVVFLADIALLLLAVLPIGLSPRVRTGWLPALFGIFVVGVFWERVDTLSVVGPGAWLFAIGGLMSLVGGLLTLLVHEAAGQERPND